jgi:phage gp29-like protein
MAGTNGIGKRLKRAWRGLTLPVEGHRDMEITAARERAPKDGAREKGISGLYVSMGRIYEDYNADLKGLQDRLIIFEEMRRSESACAVMENLISLPIRAATWRVQPGDDKDLAERIERNLMDEMTHSWDDLLQQVLLAPLTGFAVHELVWKRMDDGFIGLKKMAERPRDTINEWQWSADGSLAGIKQYGYNPATERIEEPEIPIEWLVIWTWRKEGDNPEGLGAFRQAYKAYKTKEALELFAAISVERQGLAVPIGTSPEGSMGVTETERDAVLNAIGSVRVGETNALLETDGWKIRFEQPGSADIPWQDHIERQHQYMMQTIGCHFIGLGQGGDRGARAQSVDHSSMFILNLRGIANWVCDRFNRYVMPKLVAYNADNVKARPPRLSCGALGIRDLQGYGAFIRSIFDRNMQTPPEILPYLLEEAGLPPLTEEGTKQYLTMREKARKPKQLALPMGKAEAAQKRNDGQPKEEVETDGA